MRTRGTQDNQVLVAAAIAALVTIAFLAERIDVPAEGVARARSAHSTSSATTPAPSSALESPPTVVQPPTIVAPMEIEERSTCSPALEPAAPPLARRSPKAPRQPTTATLHVNAIDAWTSAPLESLRLRAVNRERIADRESVQGSGELRLTLTPGTYSLLCLSPGYEPLEVQAVRLERGDTRQLDALRLRPGSARIAVRVRGELPRGEPLSVELFGEGRRPCRDCSTPVDDHGAQDEDSGSGRTRARRCSRCGYASGSSRWTVDRLGDFPFEPLASGTYLLRWTDRDGRTLGTPLSVALQEGETLALERGFPRTRDVRVELVDTDGSTLAEEWRARVRARAPERETFEEAYLVPSCAFRCVVHAGSVPISESTFESPLRPGPWCVVRSFGCCGGCVRRTSDDRPRQPAEELRPALTTPYVPRAAIEPCVGDDGCVRFEKLPCDALTLELDCGPFRATVAIPAASEDVHVRAPLVREAAVNGVVDAAATFQKHESARYR